MEVSGRKRPRPGLLEPLLLIVPNLLCVRGFLPATQTTALQSRGVPAVLLTSPPLPRRFVSRRPFPPLIHAAADVDAAGDIENPRAAEVLSALSVVIDPDLGKDIVSLGFIKELQIKDTDSGQASVSFDVELTTPACPVKEQFRTQCAELIQGLPWVSDVAVNITSQPVRPLSDRVPTGLSQVANIIAVSSCKGGVGKSTTAVNLAYTLHKQGAKVGILDADIYGPSLPIMVKPEMDVVEFVGTQIRPLVAHGVKLMSYGYVNEGAAVMRGPMVSQLLQQFVTLTSWGELDYLVIDMPPGTGDIQLTLCQVLNITAAVIVTTPQRLSFTDVVKGIDMFDTVRVPSVAVVENMAYYDAPGVASSEFLSERTEASVLDLLRADGAGLEQAAERLGMAPLQGSEDERRAQVITQSMLSLAKGQPQTGMDRHYIFGKGHRGKLAGMWGIDAVVQMPLHHDIAKYGDSGLPFVLAQPESEHAKLYAQLAASVVQEVAKIKFSNSGRPEVVYSAPEHLVVIDGKQRMKPADLRRRCRCAACVEEFTGVQLLNPESVKEDITPLEFAPIGNYAVSVSWSDGHKSLYPYSSFVEHFTQKQKRPDLQLEVVAA